MWIIIALGFAVVVFLPDVIFAPIVAVLWCLERLCTGLNRLL